MLVKEPGSRSAVILLLANVLGRSAYRSGSDFLLVFLQAFVVVGDHNGHVGLGVKCAKEVCCP